MRDAIPGEWSLSPPRTSRACAAISSAKEQALVGQFSNLDGAADALGAEHGRRIAGGALQGFRRAQACQFHQELQLSMQVGQGGRVTASPHRTRAPLVGRGADA